MKVQSNAITIKPSILSDSAVPIKMGAHENVIPLTAVSSAGQTVTLHASVNGDTIPLQTSVALNVQGGEIHGGPQITYT